MFQAMYTIIANIIDDGFANKMDLDAVLAYGSFLPITWTISSFYSIGRYAYNNTVKHPKTCMLVGLTVNIAVICLIFPFYKYIHCIYDLSEIQISMFDHLVIVYLVTSPLRQIGDFLYGYLMYHMKTKVVLIADILFWVSNLAFDVFVYLRGLPIWYLMVATAVGYTIYDIYLSLNSDFWKDPLDVSFAPTAFRKGFDIVIDRVTGKVATLVYGSLASRLPEQQYAIHCIVYGVICNCEEFTNNFSIYCRARLSTFSGQLRKGAGILRKQYGPLLLFLVYGSSMGYLFLYHGTVSYMSCLPWLILYMTDFFSLIFYENFKAVLSCYGRTDYLRFGGLWGVLVRIPYTYIMFRFDMGLFGFATACTWDFGIRALYFYRMIRKCEKKQVPIQV